MGSPNLPENRALELLVGSDFGAPATAGAQAKKIILVEAVRNDDRSYSILPVGRNERLVRQHAPSGDWKQRRRGWTIPDVAKSLGSDPKLTVAAFDFPFSIPISLLSDAAFAGRMKRTSFGSRAVWAEMIKNELNIEFASGGAAARLNDLGKFDPWRDKSFWIRRQTDEATSGSAPLKHKFQNVFSMTLAGAAMLEKLRHAGMKLALSSARFHLGNRWVFETYPRQVARAVGFNGSYKKSPEASIAKAEEYLNRSGIELDFDNGVRKFCIEYRTAGKGKGDLDPDGADAFLCLVAAICFREGLAELCCGSADTTVLEQEGCIIVPKSGAQIVR